MSDSDTNTEAPKAQKSSWSQRFYLLLIGIILASGVKMIVGWLHQGPMPPSEYPGIGGDFTLQSKQGPVSLHDYRNKVVILFFGYTQCPDICPTTLANIASSFRLLKGMGGEDAKVRSLFITLDPEKDTADEIDLFTQYFHSRITGLTGTPEEIAKVADLFKVGFQKRKTNSKLGYTVDHSAYIFIIRPDGSLGNLLSHTTPPKDIVNALKPWLSWANKD